MKQWIVCLTTLAFFGAAGPASAGTIRDDRANGLYTALAAGFPSVGSVTGNGILGSGTLIASDWVLTAAHVLAAGAANNFTFTVGGNTYNVVQGVFLDPGWTLANGGDIALMRLSSSVNNVTAATLNNNAGEVGNQGTSAGFGRTGTGLTGDNQGAGTFRAGDNMVDVLGTFYGWSNKIILTDFDQPGDTTESRFGANTPLNLEYMVAPGDSGGGLFINFGSGFQLSGVTSFRAAPDGLNDSDYGDVAGFVRVSQWYTQIQSTIAPVPEPTSMMLAGIGALALAGYRFRRRQTGRQEVA